MYTPEELKEIQDALVGKVMLDKTQQEILIDVSRKFDLKPVLKPFLSLLLTNRELWEKMKWDNRIDKYRWVGFLPESYDLVYKSETSPQAYFTERNRGLISVLIHPMKNIVIKPYQNDREKSIVSVASSLGVGPRQYPSLTGIITEEYIEGSKFIDVEPSRLTDDFIYQFGRRMGTIFNLLHENNIFYNDTNLADLWGRSHVIIPHQGEAKLIDFGVAVNLKNYPNLTDEEISDYARTLPRESFKYSGRLSKNEVKELADKYRDFIQNTSPEIVLSRDINLNLSGITMKSEKEGYMPIINGFMNGFFETYTYKPVLDLMDKHM